ncbi:hypothetical protein Fmac_012313 [Flemingia macrophylla]|uniref:Uncharacterized protein n=1 Tax=Flemingia macrophylla TaxID=520843 RepID=A0ABD1MPY1_9FABA
MRASHPGEGMLLKGKLLDKTPKAQVYKCKADLLWQGRGRDGKECRDEDLRYTLTRLGTPAEPRTSDASSLGTAPLSSRGPQIHLHSARHPCRAEDLRNTLTRLGTPAEPRTPNKPAEPMTSAETRTFYTFFPSERYTCRATRVH